MYAAVKANPTCMSSQDWCKFNLTTHYAVKPSHVLGSAAVELPLGWSVHTTEDGRQFFACITGERRWERPVALEAPGRPSVWRWAKYKDHCYYLRTDVEHTQWEPPPVGDAQVLPLGWDAFWHADNLRHYYWNSQTCAVTWDFPVEVVSTDLK